MYSFVYFFLKCFAKIFSILLQLCEGKQLSWIICVDNVGGYGSVDQRESGADLPSRHGSGPGHSTHDRPGGTDQSGLLPLPPHGGGQ